MHQKRVAITGLGLVTPYGCDKSIFWDRIKSGESMVTPIPDSWIKYHEPRSKYWVQAPLDLDYQSKGVSKLEMHRFDKATLNAMFAVHNALSDAELSIHPVNKSNFTIEHYATTRTGVFSGSAMCGISSIFSDYRSHAMKGMLNIFENSNHSAVNVDMKASRGIVADIIADDGKLNKYNPMSISMCMANSCADAISIKYGITGSSNNYVYACASSTIAIGEAYNAIQRGQLDCAVAGGTELIDGCLGTVHRSFDVIKALAHHPDDPGLLNRPFDRDRTGFVYSQGASAYLILEDYNSALERGAEIYCELIAYAHTFDAYHIMQIDPGAKSIYQMYDKLFEDANIATSQVDYINAHGTGTKINDQIECSVIYKLFGNKPFVNSTKSLLGHTLGASGAVETAVCCLSFKNAELHYSRNITNPIFDLKFVSLNHSIEMEFALSQSFAFGGHNAALLFRHPEAS